MDPASPFPWQQRGTPQRILVIDEGPASLGHTQMVLEQAGYQVTSAASAEDGLACLRAQPVHLVVLDPLLPGSGGNGLWQELARLEGRPATLVVSGHVDPEQAAHLAHLGAAAVLTKPCADEKLLEHVQRLLAEQGDPLLCYLGEHCREPDAMRRACLRFGMTPGGMATQVRALTGLTVLAYLRACRLDWAAGALARTDGRVKQVAAECGFESVQGFSRAFRRRHGCSPGRYRRQQQAARGRKRLR
ncbi:MAG: DNA-binding response regulator [Candidatus Latescibacterota bacterium]